MDYNKKLSNIRKWIEEYIISHFNDRKNLGHLMKHINCPDYALMSRCKSDHVNASTFIGTTENIINLVKATLLECSDEIAEWLADDEDTEPWNVFGELNENVKGIAYLNSRDHEWANGAMECSEFIIAIYKMKYNNGFVIKSCYPIP